MKERGATTWIASHAEKNQYQWENRLKCMEAGFNDYITKPINRVALFRLVNENLS